jgi:hypothetical protein
MGARISNLEAIRVMQRAGLKPLEPYRHSKHPWKSKHLKCGRVVTPTYNSIQRGQGGCAYCAGLAVDPKDAKILFELKGLKPITRFPGSKKPWKSIHVECGNVVSPKYNSVQQGETQGCHYCSKQFVDPEEAFRFFLSKDLQPLIPYPGAAKPWKSIHLICGSQVQPRYGHIKAGRRGCPICAGNIKISQKRAFDFYRSKGLEPLESFKGPHHPWKSVHLQCGRKVSPRWSGVQQGQGVCVYCSGGKVDMSEVRKVLKLNKLKPLEPYPGNKVPWRCIHVPCGREVSPRYNGISRGQSGCNACAKKVISEEVALNFLRLNRFEPLLKFPGASKPWQCIHLPCGSKVKVVVTRLKNGGKGCRVCAGLSPITFDKAIGLFQTRGFTPAVKFPGSKKPWKSRHNVCGKIVSPTYQSVASGHGCKYCQIGGIDLLSPAYLYLITNKSLNSHKIGIGGFHSAIDRLDKHIKQGWTLHKKINFSTAEQAYEIEQAILTWLRTDLNLPQYLLPEQMPQRGHTETVDASEIGLVTIWNKVLEFSKVKI